MKSVIDELSLKIDVKVKKDLDKTIRSIATAINRLNIAVSNVSNLKNYVSQLNKLSKIMLNVSKIGGAKNGTKQAKNVKPEYVEVSNAEVQQIQQTEAEKKKADREERKRLEEEKRREKKRLQEKKKRDQAEKKALKKSLNVLTRGIRRITSIGIYRAIRFSISQVVKSITEGMENLRDVDSQLDLTLKKSSQAVTSLRNSFASLFVPIITQLEPILTKLADAFANIANRQAEARAALRGQTKYSKILTSDSEEYKNNLDEAAGTLLEFDKFSVLNKDSGYKGTVEAEVSMTKEEASQQVENYENVANALKDMLIVTTALIGLSFISKFITPLKAALKGLATVGKTVSTVFKDVFTNTKTLAVAGIGTLAIGIVGLIQNWNNMSSTAKALVPTLSILVGVVTALALAMTILKGNWIKAASIGAMVTGTGLAVGSALTAQKYANGGVPSAGTLFYAGEAGAEIVANTSGGKTGVTNIAQFKTAMVQALAEYGAAKRGSSSDMVIQVNGKEFARATAGDMAGALSQKYRVDFRPR